MGLWPWVALVAWRLRNNNSLLVCLLPLLFLLGSFIKHSFAIYALCILAFLGLDRLSKSRDFRRENISIVIRGLTVSTATLVASGLLYIVLRHYAIDTTGTPKSGASYYTYNIKEIWSYVPNSPLLSAFEIRSTSLRTWSKLLHISPELLQDKLTSLLSLISPVSIAAYLYLALRKNPLARFAGITAIITIGVYFSLHSNQFRRSPLQTSRQSFTCSNRRTKRKKRKNDGTRPDSSHRLNNMGNR